MKQRIITLDNFVNEMWAPQTFSSQKKFQSDLIKVITKHAAFINIPDMMEGIHEITDNLKMGEYHE